jgi:phosphonate transport system substrate-binding protein
MERAMNRITSFSCVLLYLTFILSGLGMAGDGYTFSMLPRFFPEKINSMITPLVNYLSNELGMQIKPIMTKDFTDYEDRLKNGEIEIGYENPVVYTIVSKEHEVIAMAVKGKGGSRFRGLIITRPDSDIQTISDLKHKTIMIVGATAAAGLLSQKLTLIKNGIYLEQDCQVEMATDNKQENVIISVSIGDVDAGFIRESALHIADQYIQPNTIEVVATCEWLPNWALSVDRSLPKDKKMAIRTAVTSLKQNSSVLKAMGVTNFQSATDSQYDVIRNLLEE